MGCCRSLARVAVFLVRYIQYYAKAERLTPMENQTHGRVFVGCVTNPALPLPPSPRACLLVNVVCRDLLFRFLRSTNTHVVDNIGNAGNGELDDITDSCFTAESDRLPLC